MEPSSIIFNLSLVFGPLAVAAAGSYLRELYLREVRRCERSLDDVYSAHFQERAIEARLLNSAVRYALERAKRKVDETRNGSPDPVQIQAILGQVSEWLDAAAETSDRALRSLQDKRSRTNRSQIGIFTRTDVER